MRTENIDREKEKDQYLPLPLDDFSDARIAPTTNFLVTLTSTSVCGEITESAWRSKRPKGGVEHEREIFPAARGCPLHTSVTSPPLEQWKLLGLRECRDHDGASSTSPPPPFDVPCSRSYERAKPLRHSEPEHQQEAHTLTASKALQASRFESTPLDTRDLPRDKHRTRFLDSALNT